MTVRIAINGFGRIGRNVLRALYESERWKEIIVVAINELADATGVAYLLQYDSSHGRFRHNVRQEQEKLFICNDTIHLTHTSCIEDLPWRELNIDIVLDCTGVYGNRKHGEAHLAAGAKKVLFSHLGSQDLDATIVYGLNHHELQSEHSIVSNASCTTNCILPVIKLLDDAYNIEFGTITTIHSAMHDQQVIDTYHQDLRHMRAASQSIIPVDTKLVSGITRIFPQFNNLFEATAVRVPTINVTAIDLNVVVKKSVKIYEVNFLLEKAARSIFHGILNYIESPLVSVDFNHDPHSAIIDGTQTRVSGSHLIKTLLWCDNEWGFANRMLDTTLAMAMHGFK